jgi:hypothetical protein
MMTLARGRLIDVESVGLALFHVLDTPPSGCDQKLGDDLPMAVRNAFFGAHQAKRLRQIFEPADQEVAGPIKESTVWRAPILQVAEEVPKLEDRAIQNAPVAEELFNSLISSPRFNIGPHTGSLGVDAHVGDRTNSVGNQKLPEFLRRSAAIADGAELHLPPFNRAQP